MNNTAIDTAAFEIAKGKGYIKTAEQLSELIRGLPLSALQYDSLTDCIMKHTKTGRREAFMQGLELGIKITKDICDKHKGNI